MRLARMTPGNPGSMQFLVEEECVPFLLKWFYHDASLMRREIPFLIVSRGEVLFTFL